MQLSKREQAIQLRLEGWSYNDIIERLDTSKGTLSYWLNSIPYTPNEEVRKRIRNGPAKSVQVRNEKNRKALLQIQNDARHEFGRITKRDLWMLGVGLYIGEGTKAHEATQVVNSDPDVIRLAMKWFRDIIGLSDDHFKVTMHFYPDTVPGDALKYWSEVTGLPYAQFRKPAIDTRGNKSKNNKGKLPFGTACITINSCGRPELGKNLHRRISTWIEEAFKHARASYNG